MVSISSTSPPLASSALHAANYSPPLPLAAVPSETDAGVCGHPQGKRSRIVLYSHDTMGLGHKRRNLLIAQALGSSDMPADILMISGMRDASDVPTPAGVDCLTLPALCKREDGQYQSRRLGLEVEEIIGLRSQLIRTAVKSFQPDVLIVDNVPRGAMRELDPTLEYMRSQPHSRCVLGLRDVLDTPEAVRRDWRRADNCAVLRHYYDAIWIYGDPNLYDLRQEYGLPTDIAAKMQPLGYLDQRSRLHYIRPSVRANLDALNLPQDNLVVCSVGGGQDGAALAQAFAQATFPEGMTGVLVTGPFMPPEVQQTLFDQVSQNPQLRIVDYLEEPTLLLAQASRAIAMGGYNTTCEILSFQKPALLVPRIAPRQEQWIRAERLHQQGLVDVLHPDNLSPEALTKWLHQPVAPNQVRPSINLNGLDNLLKAMQQMVISQPTSTPKAS
ncbi:glycosyltransferase family protein [Halomicronema sp. CCY15110]|uniref:glycosyltransferase family protein n=1 Tax=Halomicronema sp. CCY15110 TaxID=2767773 RepID=UPI001EF3529C|nr:glycosyltransferase [Halomicronema sp. CCY15110]